MKSVKRTPKKMIWISGNELIERNSQEETLDELYGTGFPAMLSKFISNREQRLKEEELAKQQRRELREKQKQLRQRKAEETEMGM